MTKIRTFEFSVSVQNGFVIAALSGEVTHKSLPILEKLKSDICEGGTVQYVLFDLSEVENITVDAVPLLTHLQRDLRNKGSKIKICGLTGNLKDKLVTQGVIRHGELSADLWEALNFVTSEVNLRPTK